MSNIDNILKPYADTQPNVTIEPTYNRVIQRMPMIVTETGFLPQFAQFFENICAAVTSSDVDALYELSDRCISIDTFRAMYMSSIGKYMELILNTPQASRGIDIELDTDKFKALHRNLIGAFNVITYEITECSYDGIEIPETHLSKKVSQLMFSYKDKDFVLLSYFKSFQIVSD